MFTPLRLHYFGYYCLILLAHARGAEVATNSFGVKEVREAAVRAVGLVDRTSSAFLTKSDCFACHSQTLSVLVLRKAMQVGIEVNRWTETRPLRAPSGWVTVCAHAKEPSL